MKAEEVLDTCELCARPFPRTRPGLVSRWCPDHRRIDQRRASLRAIEAQPRCEFCHEAFDRPRMGRLPRWCPKHRHGWQRVVREERQAIDLERRQHPRPKPGPAPKTGKPQCPPDWRNFLETPAADGKRLTLRELGAIYLERLYEAWAPSLKDAESVLRVHVLPAFGELTAHDITVEVLAAWLTSYKATGYATATVRKALGFVSSLLALAIELGAGPAFNACHLLPKRLKPAKRARDPDRVLAELLSPLDTAKLIECSHLPLERRALWAGLLLTGARIGEAAGLEWRDLDMNARPLQELTIARQFRTNGRIITDTKTGIVRKVPVHPRLGRFLEEMRSWFLGKFGREPEPEDPLLPWAQATGHVQVDGQRRVIAINGPRRWTEPRALRCFGEDLEVAGIPGRRRVHATRHSFITNLVIAGAPERVVRTLTHVTGITDRKDAFQLYIAAPWPARCDAVLRLQLPVVPS